MAVTLSSNNNDTPGVYKRKSTQRMAKNQSRENRFRGAGWGVREAGWKHNEESQVRGCYNITFICTPTNQETVSVLEKTQANKTFRR